MRQFLYITPYFPPQSQVGALRPLKFARHLPALGWQPIVLCDLWPTDATEPSLEAMVPDDVIIIRDYSRRAAPAYARLNKEGVSARLPTREKRRFERLLPDFLNKPELLPLGVHSPDMPHALRAARKVLADHPNIEAIMVNADPFAASLVGARLSKATGLPLIQDFRDIWAPCKLRRPRRPLPWLWLEDWLERTCLQAAAHVIINTDISLRDYRLHYPDMPAEKFSVLRNHFDPALVDHGHTEPFDRFTLLHLGNFSRFRIADPLLRAVAQVVAGGVDANTLHVISTGAWGEGAMTLADELGVRDLFSLVSPVPYHEAGPLLRAADVLVMIAEPGADQRIASKFYDYLGTPRPVLSISDNPESAAIIEQCAAAARATGALPSVDAAQFGHSDIDGIAAYIRGELDRGRQRSVARTCPGLLSREATDELVRILEKVTQSAG